MFVCFSVFLGLFSYENFRIKRNLYVINRFKNIYLPRGSCSSREDILGPLNLPDLYKIYRELFFHKIAHSYSHFSSFFVMVFRSEPKPKEVKEEPKSAGM